MTSPSGLLCPACNSVVEEWRPGPGGRPNASCERCGALERHRLLAAILAGLRPYVETAQAILDFAPQTQIQRLLRTMAPAATYVGSDLMDLRFVNVVADGCALPFADACFDVILSIHVLEHIPDDRLAMREIHRVLKPGGLAILQVPRRPGRPTEEDIDASPEEKIRRFGQHDHVRYYGDDLEERLESAGLRTRFYTAADLIEEVYRERWGIPAADPLWICRC